MEGRKACVMDFLPEVIHIEVVEILHNYSFFLQAASLVLCFSPLLHAHSFCMLLKNAHTDLSCDSRIISMGIKHFKRFVFPFHFTV